jgi:nucleotide-binding universal stress UspA family protein
VHVKELSAAAAPRSLGYGLAGMPELAPMSGVPVPVFDPMPEPVPEHDEQKSKLVQWHKEIAQAGIKVSLHQPTGAVAEEILNQADLINADSVVMGTHGHGAMYNLAIGSMTKACSSIATVLFYLSQLCDPPEAVGAAE